MVNKAIKALIAYGLDTNLIEKEDTRFVINMLLDALGLDDYKEPEESSDLVLSEILQILLDDACKRGIIGDTIVHRDLLDTKLMGIMTPFPREVVHKFNELYAAGPKAATDWYYKFSQDTNYIRRDRIAKDIKWVAKTQYGDLDITINMSKPEKDPKTIAAAKLEVQKGYPKCLLCSENEGFQGSLNHPARQNHRLIPIKIGGKNWFFQYSPYVYYNEHSIAINEEHIPMAVNRNTFEKQLDFLKVFPHYFIGSNADLPIVGGSILSHDHFQGGNYTFAMEKAEIKQKLEFKDFQNVAAGILNWPMSVIRLRSANESSLIDLADFILKNWRKYTDKEVFVFHETHGEEHNTITPIARKKGAQFELDLVLRNNITTKEHPLGVYHPHGEYHHIKKENIGLIEVMGLAILPSRLKKETEKLKEYMLTGKDIKSDNEIAKHALWAENILKNNAVNEDNIEEILRNEIGIVFEKILENAGVYKNTAEGMQGFIRFINCCNGEVINE